MTTRPLLADERAADAWFRLVAPVYGPVVSTLVWPRPLQSAAVDRLGVRAGDRVLDVGCGTGATTAVLRGRTPRVHAVDLNRAQLERARRRRDLRGVRFARAEAGRLPYRDGTFDAVASVGAVLYWPDPGEVLAELARVTRTGGRLLLAGFNRRPTARTPAAVAASASFDLAFTTYDEAAASALCRGAGYRDIVHHVTGPSWHRTLAVVTVAAKPG